MILLADGKVNKLLLNDADIRIYSAWYGILTETDRFIERIMTIPLTMKQWHLQSRISEDAQQKIYSFDVAFAAFFMNRTTRSGIVTKAGPIGGYEQTGKWKLAARFNRERLSERVRWIAQQADNILLRNEDALGFLDRTRREVDVDQTFFFIDPPYVQAGDRLYLNAMNEAKHVALSDLLTSNQIRHWVVTYDDHELIRNIYSRQDIFWISVNYSLQNKRKEYEILVRPS